ncbi:MAG: phage portal protein, partial [Oscillospiraceae bacterium]
MAFWSNFVRKMADQSAQRKQEKLSTAQLVDLLNLGGVSRGALSEATYYACLRVLSEGVGKLPLKLLRSTEKDGVREERGDPLYRVLRYRPNPYQTATRFWSSMECARNHYGNAYARICGRGEGTTLWQLNSERVQIWQDNGKLLSEDGKLFYIWSAPNGKRYVLSSEEVIHVRTWLSPDGITGAPIQDILRTTLESNLKAQRMLSSLYDNGFTAKMAVQYTGDLSPENEKKFTASLENYATGKVNGTSSILPVPPGAKLEPLNIKLTDSQFVEIKRYSALQIAAAFGVKPNQINDYEKSSYASAEAQQLAFLVDTLLWILKDYEEEVTYKAVSDQNQRLGVAAKFNVGVMLRADTKTQIESLTQAVANSVYTPNEARAFLDLGDRPGGEILYGNGN